MTLNPFKLFSKKDEPNNISIKTLSPDATLLLFDGFIEVEVKDNELNINVTEKALDKLSNCTKPNDAIRMLRKLAKKEPFDIIPNEVYNPPTCSAYVEGALRVLINACLKRYTQLFLEE